MLGGMGTTEELQELRERLARESSTSVVALALRLRGLDLRGPWEGFPFGVVIRAQRIQPHPTPGHLIVDGDLVYSADWL